MMKTTVFDVLIVYSGRCAISVNVVSADVFNYGPADLVVIL